MQAQLGVFSLERLFRPCFRHEVTNQSHKPNKTLSIPLQGLGLSVDNRGWRWSLVLVELILIGSASSALAAFYQQIDGTILSSARLYSTYLDNALFWEEADWTGAKYSLDALDNNSNPIADTIFPTGMDQAWRDSAGMVAVPEPTTALLVGLGLIGLGVRRRS